jgi:deazaflavin-dependent oxidoreductase (nitroreductase family)
MASPGDHDESALKRLRDEHIEQVLRTGTTDGVTMKGRATVLLTYRGARTGKARRRPVIRVEHDGRYAAVASKGGAPTNPQWYASLLAEPVVELHDGTVNREYRAREVFGEERALWWRRALKVYPDFADYQRNTDRQFPVFVLEPVDGETSAPGRASGGDAVGGS